MICSNIYNNTIRFGSPIGITRENVVAFSNDYDTIDIKKFGTKNFYRGIFTGSKYECVEFVRRWLVIVCNITFEEINSAVDIWKLSNFYIADNQNLKIKISKLNNNFLSINDLSFGDIIVWNKKGNFNLYGHVAVIVGLNDGEILIAEQNTHNKSWGNNFYSRKLKIKAGKIIDIDYKNSEIKGIIKF